jgi:hypothetical protein
MTDYLQELVGRTVTRVTRHERDTGFELQLDDGLVVTFRVTAARHKPSIQVDAMVADDAAIAESREHDIPVTDHVWTRNEAAPNKLLGVEYTMYPLGDPESARARTRTLWVGLDPMSGGPNVDAGRARLEREGWEVTEWAAVHPPRK